MMKMNRHERKLDKLQKKTNNKIATIELNNKLLTAETAQSSVKGENVAMKFKNNAFKRMKHNSRVVSIASFLSFLTSMSLSIVSGHSVIGNNYFFYGFIGIMIVCQSIIYITSRFSTDIRNNQGQHYTSIKAMQYGLLFVSITLTTWFLYKTFDSVLMTIILSPLGIIIDYSTIAFNNLAYDIKANNNQSDYKSIPSMICSNLTYSLFNKIRTTYEKNNNIKLNTPLEQNEKVEVLEQIEVKPTLEQKKIEVSTTLEQNNNDEIRTKRELKQLSLEQTKNKLINWLQENKTDGEEVKAKDVMAYCNCNITTWRKLRKELEQLESKGTTTLYKESNTSVINSKY